MKQQIQRSNIKKAYRQTFGRYAKELKDQNIQKINLEKIQSINFGEDALIICTKKYLVIKSLLSLKILYKRQGAFWGASFISNSFFLALVEHDGTSMSKRTIKILDLEKDQYIASITIKFQIQQIKTSQNCICIAGVNQISIIHFPSLKPICHEFAGTGLKIIYDLSLEGLTLAYQNQKIGYVTVHNFSNMFVKKARNKSQDLERSKKIKSSFLTGSFLEKPKKILDIKAHLQHVNLIKLSPNGSRIATSSKKGTLIRIFETQNGKLWQQLRVGYELSKILDFNFYEDGNILGCLTQKNIVNIFNLKLLQEQQQIQSEKRGYKLYQQNNQKSIFSFLSFLYSSLNNEYPFAYFQLIKPQEMGKEKEKNIDLKHEQKMIKQEQKDSNKPNEKMQIIAQQPLSQDRKSIEKIEEQKPQQLKRETNLFISQKEHVKQDRSQSVASSASTKRNKSLMKKLNNIQTSKENYEYVAKIYNTLGKVFVGGDNFVWVVKGAYIYILKYDPFNGGEMYFKESDKLY